MAIRQGTGKADKFVGTAGADALFGLNGDDMLTGGSGSDLLVGGNGRNADSGGGGNDTIFAGEDRVNAGAGNDIVVAIGYDAHGQEGVRALAGSTGTDWLTVDVSHAPKGITVDFTKTTNARLPHGATITGFETGLVNGSAHNDSINAGTLDLGAATGLAALEARLLAQHPTATEAAEIRASIGVLEATRFIGGALGGSGDDRLTIDLTSSHDVLTTALRVDAGAGNDIVTIALDAKTLGALTDAPASGIHEVIPDANIDTFVVPATLDGGDGTDTLHLTAAGTKAGLTFQYDPIGVENSAGQFHDGFTLESHDGAKLLPTTGFEHFDITLGAGNDFVSLPDPNDDVPGGADIVSTGAGNDTVEAGDGNDRIDGGSGRDDLSGGVGNDHITGDTGADSLNGDSGNDVLDGGAGNDTITGGTGHAVITGDAGNDTLFGAGEGSRISGDTGNDQITDGPGNDLIHGDAGNDGILATGGTDTVFGDAGSDVIEDKGGGSATTRDMLNGGTQSDRLVDFDGGDHLIGGGGNDVLASAGGSASLSGGTGDDLLALGSAQTLVAAGATVMTGGAGADTFDFRGLQLEQGGYGTTRITDFVHGTDKIALDFSAFGTAPSIHFVAGPSPHASQPDTLLYDTTTGQLSFDLLGNGASNSLEPIATLAGAPTLSVTDIEIGPAASHSGAALVQMGHLLL